MNDFNSERNNKPDPRQLELFPGFKARPALAKCRELDELEQAERLESVPLAPYNEQLWEVEHVD